MPSQRVDVDIDAKPNAGLARAAVVLGILVSFSPCQSHGLNPKSLISQYGHTVWRVQDGYLNGNPTSFAQTADGYMWVGSQGGLYRSDGVTFTAWNPPPGRQYPFNNASIQSLYAAKDGSLWIGSASGLSHLANGTFTSISAPVGQVEAIVQDRDGAIWISRTHMRSFTGPICKVSGDNEQCYGKSSGIEAVAAYPIAADAKGRLWIGASGTLLEWDEKLIGEYRLPGEKEIDATRSITGLVIDDNGTIWAGVSRRGPGNGLQQFVNRKWRSYVASGLNGTTIDVRTLFLDRDGSLWIGTENQGLYRIHDESVDHFGHEDGLSNNSIYQIFQDREGGIWVATGEGVDHFRDLPIVTYSNIKGLSQENIESVLARRDGSIAVGSGLSFLLIRGSTITAQKVQSGLRGNAVTCLLEDHLGNLWICTGDGDLVVESNGRVRVVIKGDLVGDFISLAEDTDHAIWGEYAGAHPRLVRIENFQVSEEFKPPQIPAGFCVIADPHGGVWVSLFDGSLMHYQKGKWQQLSMDPLVRKYGRVGGIFNMAIDSDGTLWGAAAGGVVGYRNGNLQMLNARNGLPCSSAYSTISDLRGDLWIQEQCGLVRIEHSEIERWWADPESRIKVSTFTTIDGFRPGIPYNRPAATRSTDGKLWFQNQSALMMIDPGNLAGNTVVPPVHVEQVIADRRTYSARNDLRLPARTRQLELDYTGLSFVIPSRVLFRYMLEGYDGQWQEPTTRTRRAAFYDNLPPGKYTFRVTASNNSGLWNTEGASLPFTIAPAYYQTTWFRAVCVFAFGGLLWALYQLRLHQLQQQFNIKLEERVDERTRIAGELHDTLLQSFQGLLMRLQAVSNELAEGDPKQELDETIDRAARAITEARDAVQGLRSSVVDSNDLAAAIGSLGKELAAPDGRPPEFTMQVEGAPRGLHPILRDEVYRVAGEALCNAFRHADARRIEVEIRYDERQFRLRVRDNGKGMDPKFLVGNGRAGHFGLRGMRERTERVGGKLTVWSELESGTEVELRIPAACAYTSFRASRSRWWLPKKFPGKTMR